MKAKNVKELRDSLLDNFDKMQTNKMNAGLGKELANTAGKILGSVKIEIEYCKLNDIKREIDFLEY